MSSTMESSSRVTVGEAMPSLRILRKACLAFARPARDKAEELDTERPCGQGVDHINAVDLSSQVAGP